MTTMATPAEQVWAIGHLRTAILEDALAPPVDLEQTVWPTPTDPPPRIGDWTAHELFTMLTFSREVFPYVVRVLYQTLSLANLPSWHRDVPEARLALYKSAVSQVDLTGCLPLCVGHEEGLRSLFPHFQIIKALNVQLSPSELERLQGVTIPPGGQMTEKRKLVSFTDIEVKDTSPWRFRRYYVPKRLGVYRFQLEHISHVRVRSLTTEDRDKFDVDMYQRPPNVAQDFFGDIAGRRSSNNRVTLEISPEQTFATWQRILLSAKGEVFFHSLRLPQRMLSLDQMSLLGECFDRLGVRALVLGTTESFRILLRSDIWRKFGLCHVLDLTVSCYAGDSGDATPTPEVVTGDTGDRAPHALDVFERIKRFSRLTLNLAVDVPSDLDVAAQERYILDCLPNTDKLARVLTTVAGAYGSGDPQSLRITIKAEADSEMLAALERRYFDEVLAKVNERAYRKRVSALAKQYQIVTSDDKAQFKAENDTLKRENERLRLENKRLKAEIQRLTDTNGHGGECNSDASTTALADTSPKQDSKRRKVELDHDE